MMLLGAGSLVALVALCGGWFIWNANSKEKVRHSANAQSNEMQLNESRNIDDSISSNSDSRRIAASSGARETKLPVVEINRSPEQMKAIEAVRKLGSIFVDDTKPGEPIVKVTLAKHNVKGASIRGSDLEELSTFVTLVELDIEKTSITDISHIAALKNLRVLYAPSLTPDQFEVIAALPNLQSLSCSIKKPEPGEDNPNLSAKEKKRARLDFGNQDFVRQVLSSLSKSKTLQHIRMQPFNGVLQCTDESFSPIRDLAALNYLEINRLSINDAHLSSLAESKSLDTLVLRGGSVTSTGIKSLTRCQSLKRLDMGAIKDDILAAVSELPALNEFAYTYALTGRRVSDTTLMRLKRDRPQLQLADSANTKSWDRVVPSKKWPLLNDTIRQEIASLNNESLTDADLMDMEERFKALVFRVKPGMSKEQVEAIIGMADESDDKDMGDLNPQKAGQMLDICTWHGETESQSSIVLSFVNGRLQDGGTPGYDIRKGFSSKLPDNLSPSEKARLKEAAAKLGIRTDDE